MLGKSTRIHHYRLADVFAASLLFVACLSFLLFAQPVRAAIVESGNVVPAGAGSWDTYTNAYIGGTSTGSLEINAGSDVYTAECWIGWQAVGTATVNGIGSTFNNSSSLNVGFQGEGTLNITGGAIVDSLYGMVGVEDLDDMAGTGTVNVSGGSKWNTGTAIIGGQGTGTLNISGGAVVTHDGVVKIGNKGGAEGTVTVDGSGSKLLASSTYEVGPSGTGSLSVTNGGYVQLDSTLYIVHGSGTGLVTIEGTGSKLFHKSTTYITSEREGNSGTLLVRDGGTFQSTNYLVIGRYYGSEGQTGENMCIVDDGIVVLTYDDIVGSYGVGVQRIVNGGYVKCNIATLGALEGSYGAVTVDGVGSVLLPDYDLDVGFEDAVTGGDSTGVLTLTNGGYARANRELVIQGSDSRIQMATGGQLAIEGTYHYSLTAFLNGGVMGTDEIYYWDESILDWDHITNATAGVDYTLVYDGQYTVLTVGSVPVGDFQIGDADRDGDVDDDDVAALSKHWQTDYTAIWEMGDFNKDGSIDAEDATLLAINWDGAHSSVPEPSTLVGLLSLCLAGLLALARRRG